jgi:hypothetical protein
MRRILAACAVSIVAAACGSSEDKKEPSQCPAPVAPVGTLAGAGGGLGTFTPLEMGALVVNPVNCTVGTTTIHLAGIFLGFPSFQGICSLLEGYGFCFDKASSTIVSVEIANGGLVQPQVVPAPGTYTVTTGTPVPDMNGNFTVASVSYSRTGPTCNSVASSDGTTGTVTIATVTSTQVTGSMNVTFADGSTLAGSFTAATAPLSVNVCQLTTGCATTACVP